MKAKRFVVSKKDLKALDLQALSERKNALFDLIASDNSRQAMHELFNVLDVLQEKRLEESDRKALIEVERLPIECIA